MTRVLALCALLTACHSDRNDKEPRPKPGDVEYSWLVAPDTCEEAGVVDVRATFTSRKDEVVAVHRCEEGLATVYGMATGDWTLTLAGLDADGVERYGTEVDIEVGRDEVVVVPTLVLSARPADMHVTWYFANGRLCSHNNVSMVDVALFDDDYLTDSRVVACETGETSLKKLPAGLYVVDLIGRDEAGQVVADGELEVELLKGEAANIEVALGG